MPLLFQSNEWDIDTIKRVQERTQEIAEQELGLDMYPFDVQVIASDQMIDSIINAGLPTPYNHWSFGKKQVHEEYNYGSGRSGLAYEIVMNTNPCIAYLMENNTMTMQCIVLAHITGHNHVFKNNYLFKDWTDAGFIMDYIKYTRGFVAECEEKYGEDRVEKFITACHSIQMNSLDKYKRTPKSELEKEQYRIDSWKNKTENFDEWVYRILPKKEEKQVKDSIFPEENLLYFIEKYSPNLETWEREICRIVRRLSQYFYPQMQTKVLHEGMASFSHYYIMNRLYENGEINEGQFLEFIDSHSGVVFQTTPDFRSEEEKKKGRRKIPYHGINPYALGLAILQDVKRICKNPDDEDKHWSPELIGEDWKEVFLDIAANYRDESMIRQFLGPKVMRDFRFLSVEDDTNNEYYYSVIGDHSDEENLKRVRRNLANNYEINRLIPDIQIEDASLKGNRVLRLRHNSHNGSTLDDKSARSTIKYVNRLWGFPVALDSWVRDEHGRDIKVDNWFYGATDFLE